MLHYFNRRLITLAPPVFLLVAIAFTLNNLGSLPASWQQMINEALPLVGLFVGFLLSLKFNRSRYTFLLFFLASGFVASAFLAETLSALWLDSLFALLLINTLLFSLFKDRGLLSVHGILRLTVLLVQILILGYLAKTYPQSLQSIADIQLFALPDALNPLLQFPDSVILLGLILAVVHLTLAVLWNSSLQATFFGCQLGMLGFQGVYLGEPLVSVLMLGCVSMVILSIIFDSHNMAYRDELTGLPSRRALNQALLSLGRRYTVAMLDIDHFKKFNDTHGHDIGDEVLKMVASRIARVSGGGKPFRYGGEEFTVLFSGKSPEQAEEHLEGLRESIEQYVMLVRSAPRKTGVSDKKAKARRGSKNGRNKSLSVTISIGYAERDATRKYPEQVIKGADQALYRAKKKGRNCLSR